MSPYQARGVLSLVMVEHRCSIRYLTF